MALVNVDASQQAPPAELGTKTPEVLVTPCDPWPAPYYMERGLRRVRPYHYTYNTNCKERWRGKRLEDIFTSEFRDRAPDYYVCLPRCPGEQSQPSKLWNAQGLMVCLLTRELPSTTA